MLKNNTLAVALAALLVGGIATAGYMNMRDKPQPVAAPAANAGQPQADTGSEPMPAGDAIPAQGQLQYADVVAVKPITESEPLYATVIGSAPVRETSTVNTPREVCEDVVVQERQAERDGNVGGTVAGAIIGGLVGNQVGGGNGKKLATVAGAVAGGYAGREIDKRHEGGKVVDRTERQCHTVSGQSSSTRTVAWDVSYRNPDGSTGKMRTDKKPGSKIALGEGSKTVGYDVTYSLNGAQNTVRMEQKPGAKLPVIDGQVVTQTASAQDASMQ